MNLKNTLQITLNAYLQADKDSLKTKHVCDLLALARMENSPSNNLKNLSSAFNN